MLDLSAPGNALEKLDAVSAFSLGNLKLGAYMESNSTALLPVTALLLENGTWFHAKVIGLDRFLVPAQQAQDSGFLLVSGQPELTL